MGKILLPGGRWTKQPQYQVKLDRKNQLAKTITHFLPLNGDNREIVTGAVLTRGTAASTLVDVRGKSLKSAGAAACASVPIDLSSYTKASVSFWMWWDAFADDDALALEYTPNFQTDGNAGFLIDPNSGAPNTGLFSAGIGSFSGISISNVCTFSRPSAAVWRHHVFNFDRTTGTGLSTSVYLDSVLASVSASGSPADVADNFTNSSLYLFSRNNTALFGAGRMHNLTIRGGYLLTAEEAREEYLRPWQIYQSQQRAIYVSVVSGAAALAGDAIDTATATGALTTAIQVVGASVALSSATGALSTGIPLAGTAATVSTANGILSAQIKFDSAAVAAATSTGALSTGIALGGSATDVASASGSITTQIVLSGAAVAAALAAGDLTTSPQGLSGSALAISSGGGTLTTQIPLVGNASGIATSTAGLVTGIPLSGAAASVSNSTGNLTVSITMSAAALAQATASGSLSTLIQLSASALSSALATGVLTVGAGTWLGESFSFPSPITRTFDFASTI